MLSITFTTENPGQPNVILALLRFIGENCGIPSGYTYTEAREDGTTLHTG